MKRKMRTKRDTSTRASNEVLTYQLTISSGWTSKTMIKIISVPCLHYPSDANYTDRLETCESSKDTFVALPLEA